MRVVHCLSVLLLFSTSVVSGLDDFTRHRRRFGDRFPVGRNRKRSVELSSTTVATLRLGGHSSFQPITNPVKPNQDFAYDLQNFVECLHEEYEDRFESEPEKCKLSFSIPWGDTYVEEIVNDCASTFYFEYRDTEFTCSCPGSYMKCAIRSSDRNQPQCLGITERIRCWLTGRTFRCEDPDSTTTTTTVLSTSTTPTTTSTTSTSTSVMTSTTQAVQGSSSAIVIGFQPSTTSLDGMAGAVSDARLIGGVVGGVIGGIFLTVAVIVVLVLCRNNMDFKTPSPVKRLSTSIQKSEQDDQKALCATVSNSGGDYHIYELPDVIGTLPPYATSADLADPPTSNKDPGYNKLGDHLDKHVNSGHMYHALRRTEMSNSQNVINNEYDHATTSGEVTAEVHKPEEGKLTMVEVPKPEEPPSVKVECESENGTLTSHKYFVLEKQEQQESTPGYEKIFEF